MKIPPHALYLAFAVVIAFLVVGVARAGLIP